jgi:dTDP-4-amino-4,6-dideoxygalactose transaminase
MPATALPCEVSKARREWLPADLVEQMRYIAVACQRHMILARVFFMPEPISYNRPLFLEQGLVNVRKAYENRLVSGDGEFTRRCQDFFTRHLGASKTLLTTSCTDALEMCALLLEIKPGDEVIMPAFTFVSTANAFVLRGARPVFVDIRPDTLNLDERQLEAVITKHTKAIVVVHYAGIGCEMDEILAIASRHGLSVIEDNAHGLFGSYRGKPLGTFGRLATLSFHETKNLSCGEGGALLVNDARLGERAEILREKGTDRSRFFRGEIDKYTWQDVGSSFLPSDILAAILSAQIDIFSDIQRKRQQIHTRYATGLRDWATEHQIALPAIPAHCDCSYHLFYLLFPAPADQGSFIEHLRRQRINAVFHYQPLNTTPMGRKFGGRPGQYPVAESVATRIVRLPFYFDLTAADQDRVIATALSYRPQSRHSASAVFPS